LFRKTQRDLSLGAVLPLNGQHVYCAVLPWWATRSLEAITRQRILCGDLSSPLIAVYYG
jgi:hypothetical protein